MSGTPPVSVQRIILCGALVAFASPATVGAQTWTLASAPGAAWSSVASTADGSTLVAGVDGGLLYCSVDSGASWTPAGAQSNRWAQVAAAADGSRLFAYDWTHVYVSTNSGAAWAAASLVDPSGMLLVSCSADGETLAAVGQRFIVRSADSLKDWALIDFAGPVSESFTGAVLSRDGGALLLSRHSSFVGASLEVLGNWTTASTNSPPTWYGPTAQPRNAYPSAMCLAGTNRLAAFYDSWGVYSTTNSGATWTLTSLAATNWTSAAVSADGTRLVALATGDTIYSSADSGATWTGTAVTNGNWRAVASSADGANVVAVMNGGGIYRWRTTPTPLLNVAPSATNLVLSWTVPSMTFVLQQNPDLSATNWVDVTNAPGLHYSTLQHELTVPRTAAPVFFRLVSR